MIKHRRAPLYFSLAVISAIFSFVLIEAIKGRTQFANEPLHATMEALGGMIALVTAVFLSQHIRWKYDGRLYLISIAFLSKGLLEICHALVVPGKGFVLLYSAANLLGGFWFFLVWVPLLARDKEAVWKNWLPWLALISSTVFGIWALAARQTLPAMVKDGSFTPLAIGVNLLSGALFILAAGRLLIDCRRFHQPAYCFFAGVSALFGLSALLFSHSALWNNTWWLWHLLRLVAYVFILGLTATNYYRMNLDLADSLAERQKIAEELESLSLELSLGLSESFDTLKKLAAGDPSARITIKAKNELLLKLELLVNQLAGSMEELIDYTHELAIGLSEHYNTLNRIASGDLSQKASEDSPHELIAKLGMLINKEAATLIEIIEREKKSEQAVRNAYEELKETQTQLVQAAKMATLGQLASGIAHEINNPLSGVLNNVQLIKMIMAQDGGFKDINELKELLDAVEESAIRCTKITRSLLGFARASDERNRVVAVNDLIEAVSGLLSHELRLDNIVIQKQLEADKANVLGDQQLLQQVVLNIIANAKWAIDKKSPKAGGVIAIKTQYDKEKKNVCISISDTGIGIPKENLSKVFEPFFTTKEVGEGTGLGLSVAYNVIKKHKGRIEVESQENQGATFKITLPLHSQ